MKWESHYHHVFSPTNHGKQRVKPRISPHVDWDSSPTKKEEEAPFDDNDHLKMIRQDKRTPDNDTDTAQSPRTHTAVTTVEDREPVCSRARKEKARGVQRGVGLSEVALFSQKISWCRNSL